MATVKEKEKRGIDCGIEKAAKLELVSYCYSMIRGGFVDSAEQITSRDLWGHLKARMVELSNGRCRVYTPANQRRCQRVLLSTMIDAVSFNLLLCAMIANIAEAEVGRDGDDGW